MPNFDCSPGRPRPPGARAVAVIAVLLILLLVLAALVIAGARAAPLAVVGGLAAARRAKGGADSAAAPGEGHYPHPIGAALGRYARALGPEHAVGVHPLDRDRYEAPPVPGGAPREKRPGSPKPAKDHRPDPPAQRAGGPRREAKAWTDYASWDKLAEDEAASAAYLAQRAAVINNPNLDWGPVLREVGPKLAENREYIGLVNLEPGGDGRTLRLEALEASPVEAGTTASDTAFAAVPSDLVAKYARRPALFLFHTHPADPRASPLPSSHDLSTCIYFAAVARFAASVVVSRYGVFAYGLDWAGYKAVNEAQDWTLAMLNLSHDVVAAHEAVRSWASYTLQDYLAFYPRHRLFLFAYPAAEMVGDGRLRFQWDLESPIDHEVITEHSRDVQKHLGRVRGAEKEANWVPEGDPQGPSQGEGPKKAAAPRLGSRTWRTARGVADLMGVDLGLD